MYSDGVGGRGGDVVLVDQGGVGVGGTRDDGVAGVDEVGGKLKGAAGSSSSSSTAGSIKY